jgi:Glycosyltransferase 61
MPTASIVLSASPTPAFYSQIAVVAAALKKLRWSRWQPRMHVCLGGEWGSDALNHWLPYLDEATLTRVPGPDFAHQGILAQCDAAFEYALNEADVVVMLDADTLPVDDFESVLDRVAETGCVAGVMEHTRFYRWPGIGQRETWRRAADGLIAAPLEFAHGYSLPIGEMPDEERLAPFYPNFGAVFIAQSIFPRLSATYLSLRQKVMRRLRHSFFSGEVAFALAIAETGVPTWELPIRYNFPNDRLAESLYPDDLSRVSIFHYMRTNNYDRHRIFTDAQAFYNFLDLPLEGVDAVFREKVIATLGSEYPFGGAVASRPAAPPRPSGNPLSKEIYEAAIAGHMAKIAADLARLNGELAVAEGAQNLPAVRLRQTMRTLLVSGLFDADFYLHTHPDIRRAGDDPLAHYVRHGDREGRRPNAVFVPNFYRRHCMNGAAPEDNTLLHYIEEGEAAGRRASALFDPAAYLAANPGLAEFVGRPLFHFLRIGQPAGLLLRGRGDRAAALLPALELANLFEISGQRDHERLRALKRRVIARFGREEGFVIYREMLTLPDSDRIRPLPIRSLREFAESEGAGFLEIDPGGDPFVVPPPRVIGDGNHYPLAGVTRSAFIACLVDAHVRSRSSVIAAGAAALLDYEGPERERLDNHFDLDPGVFEATDDRVWLIEPREGCDGVELDEAFTLLGVNTDAFGAWMGSYLPRYVAATMSGALPPVPVLIDAAMPANHRRALEAMLAPDTAIVELPPFAAARVRRLWCAPSPAYLSAWENVERVNERCPWDYFAPAPARLGPIVAEMARRCARTCPSSGGPERVFLARPDGLPHRLVNQAAIAAAAAARGFTIVQPERLAFAEQVGLTRRARFVIAPEGSAILLACFAPPGTKLCVLNHAYTEATPLWAGMLSGIDITVLAGGYAELRLSHPHLSDYQIDPARFSDFLDAWLQ